jgi:hypothetical protein
MQHTVDGPAYSMMHEADVEQALPDVRCRPISDIYA